MKDTVTPGLYTGSEHTINGTLLGNGTIASMANASLWKVKDSVMGNVTVTSGMNASSVVIGDSGTDSLVGSFNIGTYCTTPADTGMVDSHLWVFHDIGSINIEGDIYNSSIVAYTGSIGNINVGDDIYGHSGGSDIFAEAGIGDIVVNDSIMGDVEIVAISGSIGSIEVGDNINKYPEDDDGVGIQGDVYIIAQQNIGDITILHGHIQGGVIISAGIAPVVSGVDGPSDHPKVDNIDVIDDAYIEDADDLPALFMGNIGNIDVQTGGIYALDNGDIIISATGTIGDITTGSEIGFVSDMIAYKNDIIIWAGSSIGAVDIGGDMLADDGQIIIATSGGPIDGITVRGDMAADKKGGIGIYSGDLAGLAVGGDMDGGEDDKGGIDIQTAAITTYLGALVLPAGIQTAAILVGGSMSNQITVSASSIGAGGNALTVGYAGRGSIDPGKRNISVTATGEIGDIAVRDQIGSTYFKDDKKPKDEAGDVIIASGNSSVGDIVAGRIGDPEGDGEIYVSAETTIGDIVAIDDATSGIRNLNLTVDNPFGDRKSVV